MPILQLRQHLAVIAQFDDDWGAADLARHARPLPAVGAALIQAGITVQEILTALAALSGHLPEPPYRVTDSRSCLGAAGPVRGIVRNRRERCVRRELSE